MVNLAKAYLDIIEAVSEVVEFAPEFVLMAFVLFEEFVKDGPQETEEL